MGHSREGGKFRVKFFPCCIATYCLAIVFEEWYNEQMKTNVNVNCTAGTVLNVNSSLEGLDMRHFRRV